MKLTNIWILTITKNQSATVTWASTTNQVSTTMASTHPICHLTPTRCIHISHIQTSDSHLSCILMACLLMDTTHHTSIQSTKKRDQDPGLLWPKISRHLHKMWALRSSQHPPSTKTATNACKASLKERHTAAELSISKCTLTKNTVSKNKTPVTHLSVECTHHIPIPCIHKCSLIHDSCLHNTQTCHTHTEVEDKCPIKSMDMAGGEVWRCTLTNMQLLNIFHATIPTRRTSYRCSTTVMKATKLTNTSNQIMRKAQETEMFQRTTDSTTLFSNNEIS